MIFDDFCPSEMGFTELINEEELCNDFKQCADCWSYHLDNNGNDIVNAMNNYNLLKPINLVGHYECSECGNNLRHLQSYCDFCGKRIDWNE